MKTETVKRMQEWALWYHEHIENAKRSEDQKKVNEFLLLSIDGLLEIQALIIRELQELEAGRTVSDRVWLPSYQQLKRGG